MLLFHRKIDRIPLTRFAHAASLASTSIRPSLSASSLVDVVTNTTIAGLCASTSPPYQSKMRASKYTKALHYANKSISYVRFHAQSVPEQTVPQDKICTFRQKTGNVCSTICRPLVKYCRSHPPPFHFHGFPWPKMAARGRPQGSPDEPGLTPPFPAP